MSKDFEFKVKPDHTSLKMFWSNDKLEPGIIGGQATNINFTHY